MSDVDRYIEAKSNYDRTLAAIQEFAGQLEAIVRDLRRDPSLVTAPSGKDLPMEVMAAGSNSAFPPPSWDDLDRLLHNLYQQKQEVSRIAGRLTVDQRKALHLQ